MSLKVRNDLHLVRRLYHVLGVCTVVYLYQIMPHTLAVEVTAFFSVLTLILEFLRFKYPPINRILVKFFLASVLRRTELRSFSGMTYLILGVLVIVVIFPKPVATLALLFLAFGDPIASIVGILFGKDKIIGNKSLQGALAAFFTCVIVTMVYFNAMEILHDRWILVSIIAGFIGAVSELIPIGRIDDNFTFPVISASLLWVLFNTFGGF